MGRRRRERRLTIILVPWADADAVGADTETIANASRLYQCQGPGCAITRRGDMLGRYDGLWLCDGCWTRIERTVGLTQAKADIAAANDPTPA